MPSSADRSPSGRRIFSRFTSPFASSTRNIAEFSVQLDDEHKKHSPGDVVSGHVRLRVVKPIRITHVVVCLHGFVQVYKTPGSPGEGFRANSGYLGTGRGKKSGEYFGNGFASLFEDEEVLCGDGRLAEGEYRFNFELEFPKRGLPSSIQFERGTISYMVTATLTRQNTMSPTMSCDRPVSLVEIIDISTLPVPKTRTLTLEPVVKRSRARNSTRKLVDASEKSRNSNPLQQDGDTSRQSDASSIRSAPAVSQTPVSPIPSEISFDSRHSTNRRPSQPDSQPRESPSSTPTPSDSGKGSGDKVITATIEPQTGGCLQGDYVPVKINISHTKQVTSVYGVILTLFRQARVDMRPSIPLGPIEKGKEGKYEDYYPKSITGLGGLSLSGAGSSHVFRKDLYQTMAPLYIDGQSLTAEVNAKIRVPEEAFPTISTVPGSMISFKYYVEVIVDIQGKLQGLEKSVNNLAGQAAPTGHFINSEGSDMERSAFTPFGSTIVDTTSVRRDKGVVTFTFEIVIGTKDSERRKGKQKMMESAAESERPPHVPQPQEQPSYVYRDAHSDVDWYGYDQHWYEEYPYWYHPSDQYHPMYHEQNYYPPPPPPIPIPQIPDETQMTEKERILHAETRLLPSQPPGMRVEDDDCNAGASAPFLPDEDSNGFPPPSLPILPEYGTVAPSYVARTSNVTAAEANQTLDNGVAMELTNPIAAPVEGDDKLEMQRRQLQTEASAPPVDGLDDAGNSSQVTGDEPSAPTLSEINELSQNVRASHADGDGHFELPRYEQ